MRIECPNCSQKFLSEEADIKTGEEAYEAAISDGMDADIAYELYIDEDGELLVCPHCDSAL